MRKVLFIAYHFPPTRSIGGALRSAVFAEKLSEFNWSAQVVSSFEPNYGGGNAVRLKSATPIQQPFQLAPYGWAYSLQSWLKKIREKPSIVYVSCPPYPQSMVAVNWANQMKIPVIVDFRDALTLDPYKEGSWLKRIVYSYVMPTLEKRVFHNSSGIILNTNSMYQSYAKLYPSVASRMHMIPNGYNESDFSSSDHYRKGKKMRVVYCGRFGVGGREASWVLTAFGQLRDTVRLVLVGDDSSELKNTASNSNADVEIIDQVTHPEAISMIRKADLLLLLQQRGQGSVQAVAGKTYEYLRSGRPIVAAVPDGDNAELLKKFAKVSRRVAPGDIEDLTKSLKQLHSRWAAGLDLESNHSNIEQYERSNLTKKLAKIFDSAIENHCQE